MRRTATLSVAIVAAIVALSTATFGAVHPWAFIPLMGTALAFGCGWVWRMFSYRPTDRMILFASAVVLLPVVLELVALPISAVSLFAPGNAEVRRIYELGYGTKTGIWYPISIEPRLTKVALFCIFCLITFILGLVAMLQRREAVGGLCVSILWIGVVLAIEALIQHGAGNGKIYGVWDSPFRVRSNYYGSFVNRNHFAGWMILALAVGTGYVIGQFVCVFSTVRASWRSRILWVSTPDAGRLIMLVSALAVMAVAQVWSMSRSGIVASAMALGILLAAALLRQRNVSALRVITITVGALLIAAVSWKGLDTLDAWYGNTATLQWRFQLWRDSLPALKQFWAVGSGLNTYGRVMLLYHETDLAVHAQQAHNDYLQLAIEGGLLVTIPWSIAAVLLIRRIIQHLRQPQDEMTWWIRMGAVAGICGIALQETTDFSLQIPAVALLFATVVGIAIHEPAPIPEPVRRRRTDAARSQSPALVTPPTGAESSARRRTRA